MEHPTPLESGYHFPAEWAPHRATWLSWPHKEASWPGKIDTIFPVYARFVAALATGERVCINVSTEAMEASARQYLAAAGCRMEQIDFFHHPTDDAWCRDHGPAFVVNPQHPEAPLAVVNWQYNAWGGKYPPYDQDNQIPQRVAAQLGLPAFHPGIVMEGGSIEVNGEGTLLTTRACLLNPNRNPHLSQAEIEQYLIHYYGVEQILWLEDGILGDDTDGHIDDLTRFVAPGKVVTVVEENARDENYPILHANLKALKAMRLPNGQPLEIVELPMPRPVIYEETRLPASYANFYIGNAVVVVPTFRDERHDTQAIDTLQACFPEREVLGLDSTDIIWGLGSFHCLSQQEPAV